MFPKHPNPMIRMYGSRSMTVSPFSDGDRDLPVETFKKSVYMVDEVFGRSITIFDILSSAFITKKAWIRVVRNRKYCSGARGVGLQL